MTRHLRRRLVATSILGALVAPAAAFAQPAAAPAAPAGQLEEIVVTAQHVTENLQRAAVSATVAQGPELVTRGINDTAGLSKLVPGITITPNNGYTNYNIRGITSGGTNAFSDSSIAVNYNQVALVFPSSASGLYFDLDQVELLNGPQGILFGRNSTAGAVNIVARKPQFNGFNGNVGLDLGDYNRVNARLVVNIPLSDKVAVRVAAQSVNHSGYYKDGSSDQHDNAVRASLLAQPNQDLRLLLIADYANTDSKGLGTTLATKCGPGPTDFCYLGSSNRTGLEQLQQYLTQPRPTNYNRSYFYGITGTLEWHTSLGTLSVIPAYRRVSAHTMANNASFGSLLEYDDPEQKSLEARLQSDPGHRIAYQVGFYILDAPSKSVGAAETAAAKTWANSFYNLGTQSQAGFGQLTFSVTDKIRLVGGLRYTSDEKQTNSPRYTLLNDFGANPTIYFSPPPLSSTVTQTYDQHESEKWTATTYKGGVEWDITDTNFAYADVRSGFKSGGFFFGPHGADSYDPETLTAYSIGSKNRFFDNKLQANFEAFWYDYNNQQLATNLQQANGQLIVVTENVGHSQIKGFEANLQWLPFRLTRLAANVQYAEGNYSSLVTSSPTGKTGNNATSACKVTQTQVTPAVFQFDCSGLGFVNLPNWSYNIDAQQTVPLPNGDAIVGAANLRYQASRNNSITFTQGSATPASTLLDLTLAYRPHGAKWDITAFVNNATNFQTPTGAPTTGKNGLAINFVTFPEPRTFGVRANYYF
ncbi:MAG: TonB-dependent receptor [Caulobacteraceae bacterium]